MKGVKNQMLGDMSFIALPQADLRKLKEAFDKLSSDTYVFNVMGRRDTEDAARLSDRLKTLSNAIKEVLDEGNTTR